MKKGKETHHKSAQVEHSSMPLMRENPTYDEEWDDEYDDGDYELKFESEETYPIESEPSAVVKNIGILFAILIPGFVVTCAAITGFEGLYWLFLLTLWLSAFGWYYYEKLRPKNALIVNETGITIVSEFSKTTYQFDEIEWYRIDGELRLYLKGVNWRYVKIPLNLYQDTWRFLSNVYRKMLNLDVSRRGLEIEELMERTGKSRVELDTSVKKYSKFSKTLTAVAVIASIILIWGEPYGGIPVPKIVWAVILSGIFVIVTSSVVMSRGLARVINDGYGTARANMDWPFLYSIGVLWISSFIEYVPLLPLNEWFWNVFMITFSVISPALWWMLYLPVNFPMRFAKTCVLAVWLWWTFVYYNCALDISPVFTERMAVTNIYTMWGKREWEKFEYFVTAKYHKDGTGYSFHVTEDEYRNAKIEKPIEVPVHEWFFGLRWIDNHAK